MTTPQTPRPDQPPRLRSGQAEVGPPAAGSQLRTLSLGAGVQSTTVYLLSCAGVIPTFDAAIFADTGWEPAQVYEHLARLEVYGVEVGGPPIYRVSAGNIRDDALDPDHRFASMPLYVKAPDVPCSGCDGSEITWLADTDLADEPANRLENPRKCPRCKGTGREPEGMARRQCTSEYKLKPIKAEVRRRLGFVHPIPVPRGVFAEVAIGISTDEAGRVRDSDVGYMRNVFPLIDLGWTRKRCISYLEDQGWRDVPKSACVGCPFHGNRQWRHMRDKQPEEWADAVEFDHQIRGGIRSRERRRQRTARLHVPASLPRAARPGTDRPCHLTRVEGPAGRSVRGRRPGRLLSLGVPLGRGGDMT